MWQSSSTRSELSMASREYKSSQVDLASIAVFRESTPQTTNDHAACPIVGRRVDLRVDIKN